MESKKPLQKLAEVFLQEDESVDIIFNAGVQLTKAIYGKLEQLAKNNRPKLQKEETEEQNLQTIRYKSFVASTTKKMQSNYSL